MQRVSQKLSDTLSQYDEIASDRKFIVLEILRDISSLVLDPLAPCKALFP